MSLIEQEYKNRMDALSPKQRVARSLAMLEWTRKILARQIVSEFGEMSDERLKWEVAMRQYGADPVCRKLIRRKLDHVSS